jgi:hypothetical protein
VLLGAEKKGTGKIDQVTFHLLQPLERNTRCLIHHTCVPMPVKNPEGGKNR